MSLPILYQNEDFVAIDKPAGLLVHRTKMANEAKENALEQLRDQIGAEVHPCHRLDRPTSGVLLFALNKDALRFARAQFEEGVVKKEYLAIVRGWPSESGQIDSPLKLEDGSNRMQNALTAFKTIATNEIHKPVSRYASARFGLLLIEPQTGRTHQIRRHLAHIRHPIIGDSRHGDGAQNRFARNELNVKGLMLRATQLKLKLSADASTRITAIQDEAFSAKAEAFGFEVEEIKFRLRQIGELSH